MYQSSSILNATNINSLSPACAGFIQRAAKLLSLIWHTPLFPKDPNNNDRYCLPPIFKKMSKSMIEKLEDLQEISRKYMDIQRTNSHATKEPYQREEEADEKKLFNIFQEYLKNIIEILKFISVVSKHKMLIDESIRRISEEAKNRLSNKSFGEDDQITLYDALHELAASLLNKDPNIYQLFNDECSIFFSYEDRQIIEITNKLEKTMTDKLLKDAEKIYLKYINKKFKLNKIVELFKAGKYVEGIIEVCLRKADALDPRRYALHWYKGDRSSTDKRGRESFDSRYNCYIFIINFAFIKEEEDKYKIDDKNIKLMLNSSDELFHICLYHKILELGCIEDMLFFTSPYIEKFLEEYAPYYQWIYSANHNKYLESAFQLIKIIEEGKDGKSTSKFSLQQRANWLENVISLARAGKNDDLEARAELELKLARIQLELKKRID